MSSDPFPKELPAAGDNLVSRVAASPCRRVQVSHLPYLNNIIEQNHGAVKRRVNAKQGFQCFDGACRTIQSYEVMHMIRKGQVRWLPKGDVAGQVLLIHQILGLKAA